MGGISAVILGGFFAGVFWVITLGIDTFWVSFSMILGVCLVFVGGILIAMGLGMPLVEINTKELYEEFVAAEIPKDEISILIDNLETLVKNYKIREPEVNLIIKGLTTKSGLRKEFLKDYKSVFLENG